jgi:hypothetical protein
MPETIARGWIPARRRMDVEMWVPVRQIRVDMWRLALLACLLPLTACHAPAVGFWESDSKLGNGERNKLQLYDDLGGKAEIWATTCETCNDWVEFKFDVEWEEQGTEFDLDMECSKGNCDGSDFKMECEVIEEDSGEEKMDCKGDGSWSNYPFDWQRDE